jgi:hypothetical protein
MNKFIFGAFGFLLMLGNGQAANEDAAEAVETSKANLKAIGGSEKTDALSEGQSMSHSDYKVTKEHLDLDVDTEPLPVAPHPIPTLNGVTPQGGSLVEYLEYGMVPVEDLEAQLVQQASQSNDSGKGKYYTAYVRTRAASFGGTTSTSTSVTETEASVAEEEDESDDERDDDDAEEADL